MDNETKEDKYIICIVCGDEFELTIGEQKYYASRGLSEPKRCSACRLAKRLIRAGIASLDSSCL